jgi:carboxymethylenebutenolidase
MTRCLTGRRELLKSAITITSGSVVAHFLPGSSGLAAMRIPRQDVAAVRVGAESLQYPAGDSKIDAYLAKPKGEVKRPAVIVIHDDRGLDEYARSATRRFAESGFVALAPDLLSRAGGSANRKTDGDMLQAMRQVTVGSTVADLQASFRFLEDYPGVDLEKIASVGFGWGGWRSFSMAATIPPLYRAVIYCGSTPSDGLENIEAPLLAHYAQFDFRVTGNAVWTEKTMADLGKKFTYYTYSKTDRGFFDDQGTQYNADAAKLAWTRTLEFLRSSS